MIVEALSAARRLDEIFKQTLGKPYHVLLGAGLVEEIVRSIRELLHTSFSNGSYVRPIVVVVFGLLLLVNQLAELSERMAHRPPRQRPLD